MKNSRLAVGKKKRKLADSIADIFRENGLQFDLNETQRLLSFQTAMRILTLDWITLLTSEWLSSILLSLLTLPEIAKLDSAICLHSHRLIWLKRLENCPPLNVLKDTVTFNDHAAKWCTKRYLNFQCLFFNRTSELSDEGMFSLMDCCSDLKSIHCFNDKITNIGFSYLFHSCSNLISIDISCKVLSDDILINLGKCCKQLQIIKLALTKRWNGKNLLEFELEIQAEWKGYVPPEYQFYFEIKYLVTEKVLSHLGMYCPLLESLTFINLADESTNFNLETFPMGCKNLKCLTLHHDNCRNADLLLKSLGTNCLLLEYFGYLDDCFDSEFGITMAGMNALISGCPLLKTLYLNVPNKQVVEEDGGGNQSSLNFNNLSVLEDVYFPKIDDEFLNALSELKSLKMLDVSGSDNITDAGIIKVISNNKLLETVSIVYCDKLTDASCISIANSCPLLKSISLGNANPELTQFGIFSLYNKCKNLIDIDHDCISDLFPKLVYDGMKNRKIKLSQLKM